MVQSKILAEYKNLVCYFGDKNDAVNLQKLDIKLTNIITCEQIHENKVSVLKNDKIKSVFGSDAMITNKPFILGIRTADCLPIFLYDRKNQIIAAAHAGWKGLLYGIINNTIQTMKKLGSRSKNLIISVGPHIQICCYNVPKERMDKFQMTNASDRLYLSRDNKWYLDLGKVALFQLKSLGIKDFNIEISDICTSCNSNYWSFRRDGEKSGRMVNIIGIIEN